ncbi:MAG: DNA-binding protein [Methylovulum sp.]|nr:DNA-binding protein [Methylovulum sp.]
MPSLLVRNLDAEIVNALKARAVQHHRSTEAEHRAILVDVLQKPVRKSIAEVLLAMPNVGMDSDFERLTDGINAPDVFS